MIRISYSNQLLTTLIFIFLSAIGPAMAQVTEAEKSAASKKLAADALYYDAVKAKLLGEEKQQEALLLKFIKERPEVAAAYYDLASLELSSNRIDEAEKHIKKATELDKSNIWFREALGEVLKRQKRYDEAAVLYAELGKTSDFNRPFYYEAASNYVRAKKYKEALAALDKLMESSFADELILQMKQDIYLQMNDVDGAVRIARELVEKNPKDGKYLSNLAEIYSSNNQPEKALQVYQDAIKKFPEEPTLQYGLASYYQKKKDTAQYDDYITRTILNPNLDEGAQATMLQQYLAEVEDDSVRKKHAVTVAKKLLDQQPESVLMQSFYGQILARNNQPEEAAKYLKKALDSEPSRYELWHELMLVYLTSNNPDSLITSSKKALRYFPNNAMIHYFNGVGHIYKKDYAQTVKSMNRAIELQPEDNKLLLADMYSSLGDAYNFLKDFPNSDSAYDKALSLNKDNASVLNNYSYYLSVRGTRLEDAEKMSKRSLELRPGEATFLDTYGWVLYKLRKFKEAKKYIEDAIKANPAADGTLWDHLGDINYRLNNVDEAVQNWKTAKEKGTDNTTIDKKIQDRKIYE
ncbi:MAG TPA: tetratricopeptide repeat protein [Flavipsychrobacter sp.]|nr:tetratricopeptide repeat protein [Flavipsychrobacter sp.]